MSMTAGRELDALIAEKLGLARFSIDDGEDICYSTDIAAAWMVVEKLKLLDNASLKFSYRYKTWMIGMCERAFGQCGFICMTDASTVPLVICLHALKACSTPATSDSPPSSIPD